MEDGLDLQVASILRCRYYRRTIKTMKACILIFVVLYFGCRIMPDDDYKISEGSGLECGSSPADPNHQHHHHHPPTPYTPIPPPTTFQKQSVLQNSHTIRKQTIFIFSIERSGPDSLVTSCTSWTRPWKMDWTCKWQAGR